MKYIVAAIPRTGSSLLGDHLIASGVAGKPREYINISRLRQEKAWLERAGFAGYLKECERRYTVGGVFGIKILSVQFFYTPKSQHLPVHRLFQESDKVIYITRRHRLKQAISAVKALQTREFHNLSLPADRIKPTYNFRAILAQMVMSREHEQIWDNYFEKTGIAPYRVVYEDFVADIDGSVKRILEYLEVEEDPRARRKVRIRERQYDQVNEQWLDRFLSEVGLPWEEYEQVVNTEEWLREIRGRFLADLEAARQAQGRFNVSRGGDEFLF